MSHDETFPPSPMGDGGDRAPPPAARSRARASVLAAVRAGWLARYRSTAEARALAAHAGRLADAMGDEAGAAHAAVLHAMLGQYTEANVVTEAAYVRALRAFERAGDRDGALLAGALVLRMRYQVEGEAAAGLQQLPSWSAIEQVEDPVFRYMIGLTTAVIAHLRGQHDTSLLLFLRLSHLASQVDDPGLIAVSLNNLGSDQMLAGDLEGALPHLQRASALTRETGNIVVAATMVAESLAECQLLLGDAAGARQTLDPWIDTPEGGFFSRQSYLSFQVHAAESLALSGLWDEADARLAAASAQGEEVLTYRLLRLRVTALIAQGRGQYGAAHEALAEAEGLLTRLFAGETHYRTQIYLARARLFEREGDWREAVRYLELHREASARGQRVAAQARTQSTQARLELEHERLRRAQTDSLTGLANWERLRVDGDAALMRPGTRLAVLIFNVRRFKAINDALGRDLGDAVLQAVGERLKQLAAQIGNEVCVGRLHTDQFCLLLPDTDAVSALRAHLDEAFAAPLEVDAQPIDVTLAAGCAQAPKDGRSMKELMRNAEVALYVDRRQMIGWVDYDPSFKRAGRSDLSLLSELRRAAERDEFCLFLQPKVRLADGAVDSAEALIRWQHPVRGLLLPGAFVPLAEQTGGIGRLTRWMLGAAMRVAVARRRAGEPMQVSVNVSMRDLQDSGFVALVLQCVAETGVEPADLRLEVTESGMMDNPAATLGVLYALREAGFSLAIDDFGTGQSSLAYLQKMPVDELKIDRALVANVQPGSPGATLLSATVALGHHMGLSVVGEGVESAQEWRLLADLGCDYAQGWFATRPMPVDAFLQWKRAYTPFLPKV